MITPTPQDEKAQQIISDFLADDLAYFQFGNSFKNLEADQKSTMLFATVELARKIVSYGDQRELEVIEQVRKDMTHLPHHQVVLKYDAKRTALKAKKEGKK